MTLTSLCSVSDNEPSCNGGE